MILSGIALAGRSLDMTNLTISPASADLSQPLKLSINATYPAATIGVNNINVVCNKKFELQLRKGPKSTQVNTATLRESEIDNYNTTAPGNIVTNELSSQYANSFPSLQREAVFDALRHLDGTRFSQLEEY